MKKPILSAIKIILGFSLLFLLFYKVGFKDVLSTIKTINPYYLTLFFVFYAIGLIVGATNLKVLLSFFKDAPSYLKMLKYYFFSWSVGLFVPSKLGEFSVVYFLKKDGIPLGRSLAVTIIDKYLTVLVYGIFASFFLLLFFSVEQTIIMIISLTVVIILSMFFLLSKKVRYLIKRYILRKYAKKFKNFSKTFFDYMKKGKRYVFADFMITIVRLALNASKTYFLFLGFGVHIPLIKIMMIYSITSLSVIIPITIAGLGVRQSVGMFFYLLVGVPSVVIMSNYAIVFAVNYTLASIGSLYLLFSKKNKLF